MSLTSSVISTFLSETAKRVVSNGAVDGYTGWSRECELWTCPPFADYIAHRNECKKIAKAHGGPRGAGHTLLHTARCVRALMVFWPCGSTLVRPDSSIAVKIYGDLAFPDVKCWFPLADPLVQDKIVQWTVETINKRCLA